MGMKIIKKPSRKKPPENVGKLDDFLFDDCPICQAMKKADKQGRSLSLEELTKAFNKAKKK